MYNRILVAVDGSATSDKALQEAIDLARDGHAKLKVVYVIDEVSIYSGAQFLAQSEIEASWIRTGREILDKAHDAAKSGGIDAEVQLLETENIGEGIADAIADAAKSWSADLVVAGTHGRKGLKHMLMGSVAEGIVRTSPTPILLVHNRHPEHHAAT